MRYVTAIVLCLTVILTSATASFGDVTTNPSRVVLSEAVRAGEVQVHNSGRHSLNIVASWADIRQGGDGVLHPVPHPPAPDEFGLHMWPTAFTLKPGETRPVFVVLDPKTNVGTEQRIHLRLDADQQNGKGPRWGMSMPVFVRPDGLVNTTRIENVRWASPQSVFVSLFRTNGITPYGKLTMTDDRGKELGALGNITLYANQKIVRYEIPLEAMPQGNITVRYLGSGEFSNQVFDDASLRETKPH